MNIRLFNKNYWVRRFGEQKIIRGYECSSYEDFGISANIHPMSIDKIQALPEGARHMKYLEGHGETELQSANENTHTKGDLLFYQGQWYECTSCQLWDHTVLAHFNYQFVLVPRDVSDTYDLSEPEGTPVIQQAKDGVGL